MNANDGAIECEYTANEGFEDYKLEPGCSGTDSYNYSRPYDNSEPYSNSRLQGGSGQDYYPETNVLESEEKTEPLFVIDRTKNFRLNRSIQFEVI